MPGTWALSAGGAKVAAAQYAQLLLLIAVVAALILPLYYCRSRIMLWLRRATSQRSASRLASEPRSLSVPRVG